ncbi:MAG: hypothetical protein J5950_00230 [Clostridia bacterium]|nr:hypothetical protein [Clostridia bacterium]MBR5967817.1 hypothetical protein [Lachnospiraceae bacterium]
MKSGKDKDMKILEELRKTMAPEEDEDVKTYTFRQYTVDGRKYSTLADLKTHNLKIVSPEETAIMGFAKMLTESSDQKTREFVRTVKNITALHLAGGDELKDAPIYQITKECCDKTLSTRPKSVERDLLLITAIEKIKSTYRALVSE